MDASTALRALLRPGARTQASASANDGGSIKTTGGSAERTSVDGDVRASPRYVAGRGDRTRSSEKDDEMRDLIVLELSESESDEARTSRGTSPNPPTHDLASCKANVILAPDPLDALVGAAPVDCTRDQTVQEPEAAAESQKVHPAGKCLAASPPSFAWLKALPREHRCRLRQCSSPGEARAMLVEIAASGGACAAEARRNEAAPPGLVEDLQRRSQEEQRRILELEDELARLEAAQKAELHELEAEHRRASRRGKLQLLAQWAPSKAAALEVMACDPELASLSPLRVGRGSGDASERRLAF